METLSPELMGLVCAHLKPADIRSVRATCKSLHAKSVFDFIGTHLSDMKIVCTKTKVHALTSLLSSSNIPSAKTHAKRLTVYMPDARHVSSLGKNLFSAEDVSNLFKAMPNLECLSVGGHEPIDADDSDGDDDGDDDDGYEDLQAMCAWWVNCRVVAAFVGGLARLKSSTSRIKALKIVDCSLNSAVLMKALQAHEQTLRTLKLYHVALQGLRVAWSDVFRCLLKLRLTRVKFSDLHQPGNGTLMWLEKIQDDACDSTYCSIDHTRKETDESYRKDLAFEGVGEYSRHGVILSDGWVKKGLEKILGIEDHALYPCE